MLFGFLGGLIAIGALLVIGFYFSSFLFGALLWLLIKLPLSVMFFAAGIVLCCTILLIPVGIMCFKIAGGMFVPCV